MPKPNGYEPGLLCVRVRHRGAWMLVGRRVYTLSDACATLRRAALDYRRARLYRESERRRELVREYFDGQLVADQGRRVPARPMELEE